MCGAPETEADRGAGLAAQNGQVNGRRTERSFFEAKSAIGRVNRAKTGFEQAVGETALLEVESALRLEDAGQFANSMAGLRPVVNPGSDDSEKAIAPGNFVGRGVHEHHVLQMGGGAASGADSVIVAKSNQNAAAETARQFFNRGGLRNP